MLGFSSRNKKPDFVYEQAVLITLNYIDIEYSKLGEVIDNVRELEKSISKALPEKSGIDGDELSNDEAIIYIYGPNADVIFQSIESILKKSAFNHIDITLQYGLPNDPSTIDKKFSL